jgi:DNA-binding NarL/FixJ family response regulator
MKLMIVDDHAGMRKKIRELLARPNVEARDYTSGEEAIRVAREFQPDWIIMDVHLPGVNGFEATRTIRTEVPQARIVMISAEDKDYLRQEAEAAGAEEYLCKHQLARLPRIIYDGSANSPAA